MHHHPLSEAVGKQVACGCRVPGPVGRVGGKKECGLGGPFGVRLFLGGCWEAKEPAG